MRVTKSISELGPIGIMLDAREQTAGSSCYEWFARP